MDTAPFTVGEHWKERFRDGMEIVCTLLHYEVPLVSDRNLSLESALASLNRLASGKIQSSVRSGEHRPSTFALLEPPPHLEPSANYLLLTLNAVTPRSEFVSSATGGVAFEDPFWAVLSAMALSQKKMAVLPIAANNEELWTKVSAVDIAVREGSYKESNFFQNAKGFIPPAEFPKFETVTVVGEQLAALRSRGVQTLKGTAPPRYYELFGIVQK